MNISKTVIVGLTAGIIFAGSQIPASASPSGSVPTGFAAQSTSWLNPGIGFVVGSAPCGKPTPCTALLRTSDGAKSWQALAVPEFNSEDSQFRSDPRIALASERRFLIYDLNQAMETRDAGKTWTRLTFDSPAPSLKTVQARYWRDSVYAVATTPERTDLYAAKRGGSFLAAVPGVSMARPAVATDLPEGDTLQVSFTNVGDGWPATTWRSSNGTDFVQQPYPCLAGELPIYAAHRPKTPTAVLCHSTQPITGPGHWSMVMALGPAAGGKVTRTSPLPDLGVGQSFAMLTGKLAIVAAVGGGVTFMYRSEDAGATWTRTTAIEHENGSADMTFVDNATAYLTAGSALYRSVDTGRSWQELKVA